MAKQQVTNEQIMTTLSRFADNVDKRFDVVEKDISEIKMDIVVLKSDVSTLKEDVSVLKDDVRRIYGILDAHMTRIERIIDENSVQTHQQERMQRWIFQLADEAGVKLTYSDV